MHKKLFILAVIFITTFSITNADVDIHGKLELSHNQRSNAFTAEDSQINFGVTMTEKASGELVLKNRSTAGAILIDSYTLTYQASKQVSIIMGLQSIKACEYYSHLISDSLLKKDFNPTRAGIATELDIDIALFEAGVYNNATDTEAETYGVKVTLPFMDNYKVGGSIFKDGNTSTLKNGFASATFDLIIIEAELSEKGNDVYRTIGATIEPLDSTTLRLRYELNETTTLHENIWALGGQHYLDEDFSVLMEYYSYNNFHNIKPSFLVKTSFEF